MKVQELIERTAQGEDPHRLLTEGTSVNLGDLKDELLAIAFVLGKIQRVGDEVLIYPRSQEWCYHWDLKRGDLALTHQGKDHSFYKGKVRSVSDVAQAMGDGSRWWRVR